MTTQIFIRVWENDLDWLAVCLQSIDEYWYDRNRLPIKIVATPECEGKIIIPSGLKTDLMCVPKDVTGQRRGSVYRAMLADVDTEGDLLVFLDADSVFIKDTCINDLLDDEGRPWIRCITFKEVIEWDQSVFNKEQVYPVFQRSVSEAFDVEETHYHMIGMPMVYYRDHVRECRETIERKYGVELHAVMQRYDEKTYSEFCHFGSFVKKHYPEKYHFCENSKCPEWHVRQYHSWTRKPTDPDVKEELEAYGLVIV